MTTTFYILDSRAWKCISHRFDGCRRVLDQRKREAGQFCYQQIKIYLETTITNCSMKTEKLFFFWDLKMTPSMFCGRRSLSFCWPTPPTAAQWYPVPACPQVTPGRGHFVMFLWHHFSLLQQCFVFLRLVGWSMIYFHFWHWFVGVVMFSFSGSSMSQEGNN